MISVNQLQNEKELGEHLQKFTQGFRILISPFPDVLVDTVRSLSSLVNLSDKVLPLKSYFNLIQHMQRTAYLSRALAIEVSKKDESITPENKDAAIAALEKKFRTVNYTQLLSLMSENQRNSETEYNHADEALQAQLDQDRIQKINQQCQPFLCNEDTFIISCAFIDVEIGKQGSFYYLRGEAPEFRSHKETKKNRVPKDLHDETVLKALSSALARPDSDRGEVERNQIDAGYNHLAKLVWLHQTMHDVIHWIDEGEKAGSPRRKIDVMKKYSLKHIEYERMMTMARRENLTDFKKSVKEKPSYKLNDKNHQRVLERADQVGCTPQKALNMILTDFFAVIDKQKMVD